MNFIACHLQVQTNFLFKEVKYKLNKIIEANVYHKIKK